MSVKDISHISPTLICIDSFVAISIPYLNKTVCEMRIHSMHVRLDDVSYHISLSQIGHSNVNDTAI